MAAKRGFLQAARAVFWSFLGIRRGRDYEHDAVELKPAQVIVVGVLAAALFVAVLLGVVALVIRGAA